MATILCATLALSLTGCGGNGDNDNQNNATTPVSPGAPAGTPDPAAGTVSAEAVYSTSCITCHAADLSGGMGPELQKVGSRMTADEIGNRIANGGGGMPAFKGNLTDDQINALTQWLAAKT